MRWLFKLLKYLIKISRQSQIPPLPRMAAAEYTSVTPDEARVMARYGIRSPSGIKAAMKKYQVNTIDELIIHLEHHRAKRKIYFRWLQGVRRLSGGTVQNPHTGDIRKISGGNQQDQILRERIKRLRG